MALTRFHLSLAVLCCLVATVSFGHQAETITVDDPRALAKALDIVEGRYGWIVTYEDPRYVRDADVVDVTKQARRSPDPSKGPILIPRGGSLTLNFARPPADSSTDQVANLLSSLVMQFEGFGLPGKFTIATTEGIFHVTPTSISGTDGRPVAQRSILDAVVSLPAQKERTAYSALQVVLGLVGQATGQQVWPGTVPINLLAQSKMEAALEKVTARQMMIRILESTGRGLSWRLFYDPGLKLYVFNVHPVR
jgi:hypothetical protein